MVKRYGLLIGALLLVVPLLAACAAPPDPFESQSSASSAGEPTAPGESTAASSTLEVPGEEVAEQPEPAVVAGPIAGTWIEPGVYGDTVVVSVAAVESVVNTKFSVPLPDRTLDFMAYVLDGAVHVRASVCPPCRSRGFALDGVVLVCDACATTFDAVTGEGIAGACVDYPKAEASCSVADGLISMTLGDLVRAYDETLVAGSFPLVEEVVEEPEPEETALAQEPEEEEEKSRPSCCG